MGAQRSDDSSSIALELGKLRLERQRLALDVAIKRRELAAGKSSWWRDVFGNPLSLAIVGGFVSLMTSIATSSYSAKLDRERTTESAKSDREQRKDAAKNNVSLEDRKAQFAKESASEELQAELIKKFVEGPSILRVRQNLTFLADAGLIPTYEARIRKYLAENPDAAPQVPSTGSVAGLAAIEGVKVAALPAGDALKPVASVVGQVRMFLASGGMFGQCTGFLIAPDQVMTASFCNNKREGSKLRFDLGGTSMEIAEFKAGPVSEGGFSYAIARLGTNVPSANPLQLSSRPPRVGEALSIVFYLDGKDQFAGRAKACKVISVENDTFEYGCKTGGGASGSPILTADGKLVLGIHLGAADANNRKVKQGLRADRVSVAIAADASR